MIRILFVGVVVVMVTGWLAAASLSAEGESLTEGVAGRDLPDNPVEVGHVRWGRDLDAAYAQSAETGKPVLVLFQEVPGCTGCREFGKNVLTQPLLVEAIEDEFIPVLVFNNRGGKDKNLLEQFNEPAWNYQVIRFLDAKGQDIIPRKDRVWTTGATASRMAEALAAADRDVPRYLETVVAEAVDAPQAVSAFSMFCFWTGEMELGQLDGVVSTEAGWFDGHEVTRVAFDPHVLSLEALTTHARSVRCADKVYTPGNTAAQVAGVPAGQLDNGYRKARRSDQMRQLTGYESILELPGLNEMQKTKVNAFIRSDAAEAMTWLSPRQRAALTARTER